MSDSSVMKALWQNVEAWRADPGARLDRSIRIESGKSINSERIGLAIAGVFAPAFSLCDAGTIYVEMHCGLTPPREGGDHCGQNEKVEAHLGELRFGLEEMKQDDRKDAAENKSTERNPNVITNDRNVLGNISFRANVKRMEGCKPFHAASC